MINQERNDIKIVSVRENPAYKKKAIAFFQQSWKSVLPIIHEDCISHSIGAKNALPQWYLLEKGNEIIGGAGLITNDFISRGDLYPWVCAVFINKDQRGNNYSSVLLEKAKRDTQKFGFKYLYLCTEHIGFYEKFGFEYIGQGYHPWGEASRIYQSKLD